MGHYRKKPVAYIPPEMKNLAAHILRSHGIVHGAYDIAHDLLQRVLTMHPHQAMEANKAHRADEG